MAARLTMTANETLELEPCWTDKVEFDKTETLTALHMMSTSSQSCCPRESKARGVLRSATPSPSPAFYVCVRGREEEGVKKGQRTRRGEETRREVEP
eukprot:768556-Hanusia_phi.AAC.8